MRWIRLVVAVLVIALALPAEAAGVPTGFIVITIADRIAAMNALDPASVRAYFDTNNSYGLVTRGERSLQAAQQLKAEGWRFQLAEVYYSLAAFRADLAAHAIAPGVTAVVYDNEDGFTQGSETGNGGFDDPTSRRAATRDFYTLAKEHNLTVILAPGTECDANRVLARRVFTPQACYAYLRDIARYANIIDPQLQGLIRDPRDHLAAIRDSAALIRAANPSIKILAQFTTSAFRHYTPEQNVAAMRAALPYVNGFWANLPLNQRSIREGIDILKAIH